MSKRWYVVHAYSGFEKSVMRAIQERINGQGMKEKFGKEKLTVKTGLKARIDFKASVIEVNGKSYAMSPVGEAAQELIVSGGLENWTKNNL